MRAIDIRNAKFADLASQLVSLRASVYEAWLEHGPGTTREVAKTAGADLLMFRPRTTELVQLGFVTLIDQRGHEGIYAALTVAQAETIFHERQRALLDPQATFDL